MDFLKRRALASGLLLAVACVPDVDTDEATVRAPRVLAVVAEPAEAKPGVEVQYSALVADADGRRDQSVLAWFYCLAQKPLAELGPVDRQCLTPDSAKLTRIGKGGAIRASLPATACSLFGPNIPPPEPGQEPGRPVDADDTGGYRQPIVLALNAGQGDELVLFEQRIACDLPGVSAQTAAEYRLRYHENQNPRLRDLIAQRADGERVRIEADQTLDLARGELVRLFARWEGCPESDACGDGVCGPEETRVSCSEDCAAPRGCDGQERYLWFDSEARKLTLRRESMRLAWYATGGSYAQERTGVDEDDQRLGSSNSWTAPDTAGQVTLFVVARDARGGVATFSWNANVR